MNKQLIYLSTLVFLLSMAGLSQGYESVIVNTNGHVTASDVDIDENDITITNGGTEVEINNGDINISTVTGNAGNINSEVTINTGAESENAAAYPDDIYKYPKGTITTLTETDGNFSITVKTKDDSKKVFSAFQKKMKKSGWSETMAVESDGEGVLTMTKNTSSVQITIAKDEQGTVMTILKTVE